MIRISRAKAKLLCAEALKAFRRLCIQSPARAANLKEQILELAGRIDRKEQIQVPAKSLKKTLQGFKFKSPIRRLFDLVIGLLVALAFAVVIRQMWLELFQVPTGSMRPTIREKDNLLMSKEVFGINIPLSRGHFAFHEKDLKRLSVTLFTGMGLPISNNYMLYFWLFPGVKQYVKRCVAKGGDQLYFYGGRIYGLDKEGRPLGLESSPVVRDLEYIPYLAAEGQVRAVGRPGMMPELVGYQMNEPTYKATVFNGKVVDAEFFDGTTWKRPKLGGGGESPGQYRELWGMGEFAKVRMIQKEEGFALELFSIPNFTQGAWQLVNTHGGVYPRLLPSRSEIALEKRHIDALMDTLYTSRFVVRSGKAHSYDYQGQESHFAPTLEGVSDGTYEFYGGKLYEISWLGSREVTNPNHPLLQRTPETIEALFNMGIQFNAAVVEAGDTAQLPMRYAYYREGDLFVMGGKIFDKEDPLLKAFVEGQIARGKQEGSASPFVPFVDRGPPSAEKIRAFGLRVPKEKALMLGDNHANSGDSRVFGFVPYANIRGTAEVIFWPPRDMGRIQQPAIDIATPTRAAVWSVAAVMIALLALGKRVWIARRYNWAKRELMRTSST